jgi:hypothetical protein
VFGKWLACLKVTGKTKDDKAKDEKKEHVKTDDNNNKKIVAGEGDTKIEKTEPAVGHPQPIIENSQPTVADLQPTVQHVESNDRIEPVAKNVESAKGGEAPKEV